MDARKAFISAESQKPSLKFPKKHLQKYLNYDNIFSGRTVKLCAPLFYGSVVKRLRHRPFTAVTRVRFPSESLVFVSFLCRRVA